MNRTELHKLIDTLPESRLSIARAYLEGLRDSSRMDEEEARRRFLVDVEAGLAELDRGERVSHEEVEAEIEDWLNT